MNKCLLSGRCKVGASVCKWVNARVRYAFRNPFRRTEAIDLTSNLPLYQDKRYKLDSSISFDVNPQFALTCQVLTSPTSPIVSVQCH